MTIGPHDTPTRDQARPRTLRPVATSSAGRELPDNFATQIGEHLQTLRQAHGLSQREAAQLLGVSQAALSKLESGKSIPSLATLLRLQVVFDLDTIEAVLGRLPGRALADLAFDGP